jgi:hypothetical protein
MVFQRGELGIIYPSTDLSRRSDEYPTTRSHRGTRQKLQAADFGSNGTPQRSPSSG